MLRPIRCIIHWTNFKNWFQILKTRPRPNSILFVIARWLASSKTAIRQARWKSTPSHASSLRRIRHAYMRHRLLVWKRSKRLVSSPTQGASNKTHSITKISCKLRATSKLHQPLLYRKNLIVKQQPNKSLIKTQSTAAARRATSSASTSHLTKWIGTLNWSTIINMSSSGKPISACFQSITLNMILNYVKKRTTNNKNNQPFLWPKQPQKR